MLNEMKTEPSDISLEFIVASEEEIIQVMF